MTEKIKKYILYFDEEKNKFDEKEVGEEEKNQIDTFFILKKNGLENVNNLPYIELMKPVNQFRTGSTKKYHKIIYFFESNKKIAKNIIVNDFHSIFAKRSKESLVNLKYVTEKNIKFANDLIFPSVEKIEPEKLKKKKGKK